VNYYGKKNLMRINKFLAQAGLGSRRKVEELITSGKIKVNGKVCTLLFTDVKETDIVSCDNRPIKVNQNYVYYKLHKPKGYVTTAADDKNRKTVMDLMRAVHTRVYPVGRLDYDTEGLLLLTNDGELANILTKPSSNVEKTYIANVEGVIGKAEIKQLSTGVEIDGYTTKPCSVQLLEANENACKVQLTITEGKNRQIRKMIEAVGCSVKFLKRVAIGEIRLGGLSRGEYKELTAKEIKFLNRLKK